MRAKLVRTIQWRSDYWVTTTGPQAMGDASIKLLRFVPRVTTTYQAVLGADDTLPIVVVLDALPELSPVSGLSPWTEFGAD